MTPMVLYWRDRNTQVGYLRGDDQRIVAGASVIPEGKHAGRLGLTGNDALLQFLRLNPVWYITGVGLDVDCETLIIYITDKG